MKRRREAFTLFELILAIALAAVLLTLIGTAINVYLVHIDSGRARVVEAQLARNVLTMIADDIRATTIYQPQDTAAIAQLMAKTSSFDVDDIDKPRTSTGETGGTTDASSAGGLGGAGSVKSIASLSSTAQSAGQSAGSEGDDTMPLGINGGLQELYVDATRLPRQEELFSTTTGYTNAPSPRSDAGKAPGASAISGVVPAADLKTIRYYVRPGAAVEAGSVSATSLDPAAELRVGGLVRQETPRAERVFAEQHGGANVLQAGEKLIAPEVVQLEIRYFDGSQTLDTWDMKERKSLPVAVEVCIWVRSPNAAGQLIAGSYSATNLANSARDYRQVVYLPMAALMKSQQSSETSETSTDASSTSSSSTGQTTSGSASGFGETN